MPGDILSFVLIRGGGKGGIINCITIVISDLCKDRLLLVGAYDNVTI